MNRFHFRKIIIVKGMIAVGLVSVYVVPPQYAPGVGILANFLWLFWPERKSS